MILDKLEFNLIKSGENFIEVELILGEGHPFFEGHFPDLPLLPGVLQTHLAVRIFEKHFDRSLRFSGVKNIKFFRPIFPGRRVCLECRWDETDRQLQFKYFDNEIIFAKGAILNA